jgi:hypothetical protein
MHKCIILLVLRFLWRTYVGEKKDLQANPPSRERKGIQVEQRGKMVKAIASGPEERRFESRDVVVLAFKLSLGAFHLKLFEILFTYCDHDPPKLGIFIFGTQSDFKTLAIGGSIQRKDIRLFTQHMKLPKQNYTLSQ